MLRRLFGAVMVGVATLFVPKAERDQHWSVPPTWPVDATTEDAADPSGRR